MAHTPSQNVTFTEASVTDGHFEPPGRDIAVRMRDYLRREGFAASNEENWRDCGWSVGLTFPEVTIQIALARSGDANRWIAQVAPLKEPGLLAQLFGRPFMSHESEVLTVSRTIHRWLLESGSGAVLWCVDGFPEPGNGVPEPMPSGRAAAS